MTDIRPVSAETQYRPNNCAGVRPGALILVLLLLLSGCASESKSSYREPPDDSTHVLERIRSAISGGSYGDALSEILLKKSDPSFTPGELDGLYSEAVDAAGRGLEASAAEGDFGTALADYRTLRVLGAEARAASWSEGKLLLAQAERELDSGRTPSALLIFRKAMGAAGAGEKIPDAALLRFGAAASAGGDESLLADIVEKIEDRAAVPDAWKQAAGSQPAPGDLLKGTATVLVNRGMRIQGGLGFPDRVVGSAFFIDVKGYLLTNYHVIESEVDPTYEGYSRLYIIPSGSKDRIPARVVGYDRVFDLALLKTDVDAPYTFPIIPGRDPRPGDPIYAIGSPVGLENTVTSGIISAVERRLLQIGDVYQIDVPVNPGNSGGPLLERDGRLTGIVFAGLAQFQGLNFAIPVSWIAEIVPSLMAGGETVHPWIGTALCETSSGLEIIYAVPGSPAYRAGMGPGDILKSVGGKKTDTLREAQKALLTTKPGTLVPIVYARSGAETQVLLSAGARPYNPLETALDRDTKEHVFSPLFGMQVKRSASVTWPEEYLIEKVYPGSIADETGFLPGDPFTIKAWKVDRKAGIAALGVFVKKRRAGFLESAIQLTAYLETDSFL